MENETIESPNDPNEFYFESDHLALRGNSDYLALLNTVIVLEAQRTRAIEQLDTLLENRDKALKDPISFLTNLQNNELPDLPGPNKVQEIPLIDWSKYNVGLDRVKPQTRNGTFFPRIKTKPKQEDGQVYVRGRVFNESKPETFNQLWSTEEQRRLEELLRVYPPEEVEMRRWTKIANALGNRTPKQVSSRVQKYFIKLLRAGLPIPGRGPKNKVETQKSFRHKHQKNNWLLMRKSTFFPQIDFPEREHIEIKHQQHEGSSGVSSADTNSELEKIEILREIKMKREEGQAEYLHYGYRCFICEEEPIKGPRFNCIECSNVNLCSDCEISSLESVNPKHPPSHKFQVISSTETISSNNYDRDYLPDKYEQSSFNQLGPNISSV